MLPPLASLADLQTWSASDISNEPRAAAILAAASTLVRAETGRAWVDADNHWEAGVTDLQKDQVQTVVVVVADRVYRNPDGATTETAGPFSHAVADWAALGLALSDEERDMLPAGEGIPGLSAVKLQAPADAQATRLRTAYWWENWTEDFWP